MVYNFSEAAVRNNLNDLYTSHEPALAILDPFVGACKGRALFITDDGVIGLAPNMTRPEDKLCVIHGCRVPFIIRRIEEQKVEIAEGVKVLQSQHVLVGECYAHGFMKGEAVKNEKVEATDIFLI